MLLLARHVEKGAAVCWAALARRVAELPDHSQLFRMGCFCLLLVQYSYCLRLDLRDLYRKLLLHKSRFSTITVLDSD